MNDPLIVAGSILGLAVLLVGIVKKSVWSALKALYAIVLVFSIVMMVGGGAINGFIIIVVSTVIAAISSVVREKLMKMKG